MNGQGINVAAVERVFVYNGRQFPDPDPSMTEKQVKQFLSGTYPELVNAEIEGGQFEGGRQVFEFRRALGTKGSA